MSTFTDADRAELAAAAAAVLRVHWPSATTAGTAPQALPKLWQVAAELGWFDLAEYDELGAALAITRELGRLACPLPLIDGYVAAWLAEPDGELRQALADGRVRITASSALAAGTTARFVECAATATHVLVLRPDDGPAGLYRLAESTETPGLAAPAWSDVRVAGPEVELEADAGRLALARAMVRLGLATRAAAAAGRTHELAVEHANTRAQFGRIIGTFGAVQQRTASAHIDVHASRALLALAEQALGAGSQRPLPERRLAVALAAEHVRSAAPRVQLAAQHTLAASGYFEDSESPWLFRRVHADAARITSFAAPGDSAGDLLVEEPAGLPPVTTDDPAAAALRSELRALFDAHLRDDAEPEACRVSLRDMMVARGHFGMGWPTEHGGRSASVAEQVVLNEEIQYWRAPVRAEMSTVMLLGGAILRHGTDAQRAEFLPRIRRGEIRFCLGYSEPEVGSDLASLATRAAQDGDGWVINGQKAWTTNAHVATHVWLACRTNPAAQPRHAGITVFLVPMDTPGITVQQHTGLSGDVSCDVFYDNVRVPDSARVGEVDGGWRVITDALAGERVVMGSVAAVLRRHLDDVLANVRRDIGRHAGPRGSLQRAELGRLAFQLQATRALVARAVAATTGGSTELDAPMAGVLGGEVAEDFGETLLQLFGPDIALAGGAGWPDGIEQALRLSIMYVVGGGTNDVQRGMIARALGLPR